VDPFALSDRIVTVPGPSNKSTTLKALLTSLPSSTKRLICAAAGVASLAAWWHDLLSLDHTLPLVCGLAAGYCAALLQQAETPQTPTRREPEPEPEPIMWTLAQFETLGALRFDNYLRFLITKLAVVWRTIATLHKTALNYRFTVSISDKPSLAELQDLIEGRVPLQLTYDDISVGKETDEPSPVRSRGSSLASTAFTDDSMLYRDSMDLSGLDMDLPSLRTSFVDVEKVIPRPPPSNEFQALEDQDQVTEYFTIEDDASWSENESDPVHDDELFVPTPPSSGKDEIVKKTCTDQAVVPPPSSEARLAALRSILVPMLPLEELACKLNSQPHAEAVAPKNLQPLVVPSVNPLVQDAKPVDWQPKPTARPEAAALLARAGKPTLKRRISVNVATTKPHPRLVVKARPSTLSPPQNVQKMLDQVERMMREVQDLLEAGREALRRVETPEEKASRLFDSEEKASRIASHKSVSFSDDVDVIDAPLEGVAPQEERALRTSLSYGDDEIEWMTNEFFADLAVSSLDD
jgi:hypothetical protein